MQYKQHNLIYAQKIVNDWLRSIATIFFHVRDWIQSISIQTRVTSLIIMMATLIRVFLLASGWPLFDSDQGTMGLAALHIFHGTDYPIFFYGQTYMGIIEAYIAALMFHIFGISSFSLRIGLLFFYVGFLINMFLFTRKLFSANFAVFTILLLALGAPEIVYWQLSSRGGYPEIPFFASSLLLIAVHLALKREQQYAITQQRRHFLQRDVWFYGMWGFIAGFSIYDDPLIIPFVVITGFILLICLYRRKVIINYIVILVTFLIGISPIFIYTMLHPSSSVFQVVASGFSSFSSSSTSLFTLNRLKTLAVQSVHTVLISIPVMTGGNTLCPTQEVEHLGASDPATEKCIAIHALWGVFITALLLFAGYIYLRNVLKRQNSQSVPRASILKEVCRFASILGMIITILLLILSSHPYNIITPWRTSRYLIAFEVVMPCMLYPLWEASCNSRYFQLVKRFGQVSLLIIICTFAIGMLLTFNGIQNAQATMLRDKDLISTLQRRGIVHIYTIYGPCNGLTFLSQGTILCNIAEDPFHPTGNRYIPDGVVVEHDPKTVYVYPVGSPQSHILLHSTAKKLTHSIIDGFDIFTNT